MIKQINHVAIVVDNIEEAAALFSRVFGFERVETYVDPNQTFKSAMVRSQDATCELLEPIGDGPIAKYLRERGGGLHHLSLEVDDLEKELESLRKMGVRLIDTEPQTVGKDKLAFIHPRAMKGVLIELIQKG
jgi:methylmalonyl-CoA epimerase